MGSIPTEVKIFFSLPRVVPCFPLLGLTPSGFFMGLSSTIIYTSELIPCSTICSQCYAAQHSYVPLLSLRRDSPSKIVPDFSLPHVVPCFPLLGLTPSELFMGLKGPSQPHLCFCLHARIWLLYFIRSLSKRRKIIVKLLKIIKHTFRNTAYSKTIRIRFTMLYQ